MKEFTEFISNDIVSGILTCFGLLISVVLYYASKNNIQLCYQYRIETLNSKTLTLSNPINPDLMFLYDRSDHNNTLKITNLVLWNGGKKEIRRGDISEINPLHIKLDKSKILFAKIVSRTKFSNNFEVKIKDNKLICEFDYLNNKDGVNIEIISDGRLVLPFVTGDMIGVQPKITDYGYIKKAVSSWSRLFNFMKWIISILSISFGLLLILISFYEVEQSSSMSLLGLLYLFFGISLINNTTDKYPARLIKNKKAR